jgi:hypothetical protein
MAAPRVALLLCLVLFACGGNSSSTDLGNPDVGGGDAAVLDQGDLAGVDLNRPDADPGVDVDDAMEPDGAGSDQAATDPGQDGAVEDPGADPLEPDALVMAGTCAAPIDVWGGKAIGVAMPTSSLGYQSRTGQATAVTAPSCGLTGPQGELVFRMLLDGPVLAITSVEAQVGDMTPTISYVRESCSGSEEGCTLSDNAGRMAELATALGAGTYLVIVRLAPQAGGNPEGVLVDVSFDFEPGEICNDKTDNNEDGDTDCDDPTCFADVHCTGGATGEDCADPFLVNGGVPVAGGVEFFASGTLGGRRDDYLAPAPCWPGSAGSGDGVWRVVLDRPMTLEIAVGFYDGTFGQAYVLDQACATLAGCVPASFTGDPNLLVTLPAGTWHVVVDRGATVPATLNFELAIYFDEP